MYCDDHIYVKYTLFLISTLQVLRRWITGRLPFQNRDYIYSIKYITQGFFLNRKKINWKRKSISLPSLSHKNSFEKPIIHLTTIHTVPYIVSICFTNYFIYETNMWVHSTFSIQLTASAVQCSSVYGAIKLFLCMFLLTAFFLGLVISAVVYFVFVHCTLLAIARSPKNQESGFLQLVWWNKKRKSKSIFILKIQNKKKTG